MWNNVNRKVEVASKWNLLDIELRKFLTTGWKEWEGFFLIAFTKKQKKKNELKKTLLSKNQAELETLKNPQPIHFPKKWKKLFWSAMNWQIHYESDSEIWSVLLAKPRIEMGIEQTQGQFELVFQVVPV
jgi:hypothetical protein